ncbi:MAG: FxsA family protein [Rhodospirillales bacterium]|nr:FxsA family protein [Rhodospirillales bacterium]
MPFFIIFLIIPLIEIGLFITVGEEIGLVSTLLLCVLTAVIGAALIRHQGLETLFSARRAMDRGEMPVREMFDGLCLAVAGALLMTPGFFTDAIGFSLTIPAVRSFVLAALPRFFDVQVMGGAASSSSQSRTYRRSPDVIEAEYEVLDEDREDHDKP